MAGNRELRIVGPSAPQIDLRASAQRSVNMYASAVESSGEDRQFILRSCQGGAAFITCTGELRGMLTTADGLALIYVDDNDVVEKTVSASTTYTGSLSTTTGPVSMALGSGGKVVIVDGTAGYVADIAANTVTAIADADFPDTATQVAFLDGYWIVGGVPNSDTWYISALDDPTAWDALDFTSADRLSDNIVAIRVSKQEVYLFGERSCEIWYNAGGADFPFSRYTQAPIDIGVLGPFAACTTTDSLAFAGRAASGVPMVYLFDGHTPRRISTRAVEEALRNISPDPTGAFHMWSYQAAGSEFIGIDLVAPDVANDGKLGSTWVYDMTSGLWHEREALGASDAYEALESVDVVMYRGAPYMGLRFWTNSSTTSWRIFGLGDGTYEWGGRTLRRERVFPHMVSQTAEPVRYASLELLCTTGDGTAGSVSLEVSNDGGESFGTAQTKTISTSDKTQRVRWTPLGQARDRVFRVRCDSAIRFQIFGAQVEVTS